MITSPFSTRKYRSPSSPIDPLFPGQAIKKTCRDHLPPLFSDPSSHNRKRHLLQLAQHTIPNGIGKKMKKFKAPMNGRGWSAVGERIFQALRHLESKQVFCNNHIMKRIDPHRPNTPFYSKMEKILCLILKKKHSHRGSSLRDSPKTTEITTYPGYHVHISCDDLRSTDLGNNLGKLQPCHALLWVSWHHAGTWRSNLDSWIDSRQVGGHCGYPPLTLVDAGPTTSHSL